MVIAILPAPHVALPGSLTIGKADAQGTSGVPHAPYLPPIAPADAGSAPEAVARHVSGLLRSVLS